MIRIGSKRARGVKGQKDATYFGYKNIDVTSGSMNVVVNPITKERCKAYTLSPIKGDTYPIVETDGVVFHNFEMYWQGNKAYKELGHVVKNEKTGEWDLTAKFWAWRKKWAAVKYDKKNKYKRKLPGTSGIKPIFGYYEGKKLTYVEARDVYLRKYCEKIKELPVMDALLEKLKNGEKIMLIDGDGPFLSEYPQGHEPTTEFIQKMSDDPNHPFGHGYCVAYILYILYNVWKIKSHS